MARSETIIPSRRWPLERTPTTRLMAAATEPTRRMNVSFGSHAPRPNLQTGLLVSRMLPSPRCNCHQIEYSSETWSAGGLLRSKLNPDGSNSFFSVAYRKYSETMDPAEKHQNPALKR